MDWILLSLIGGLISGICWLIGDIFLVGYDIEEEKYQDFLKNSGIKNRKMAVLMLSGSVPRLRFGALVAHFTIPFMLFSILSLYSLAELSHWRIVALIFLGVGFSISPVAHVGYYYIGTLSKSLLKEHLRGASVSKSGGALINEYVMFLDIVWWAAIGFTFIGWFIYAGLILFGKTIFPPLFCLLTPLVMSPVSGLLSLKLKIGRPYLNGAGLSIGLVIFFLAALIYYLI